MLPDISLEWAGSLFSFEQYLRIHGSIFHVSSWATKLDRRVSFIDMINKLSNCLFMNKIKPEYIIINPSLIRSSCVEKLPIKDGIWWYNMRVSPHGQITAYEQCGHFNSASYEWLDSLCPPRSLEMQKWVRLTLYSWSSVIVR